jgi:hypothetical protein
MRSKYRSPGKRQREIEFELFSRNFLEHRHDPKKCDPGPRVRAVFARAWADHCVLGA